MFIELEDLEGCPVFLDPHKISGVMSHICIAEGIEYEVNHTAEEIIKTIRQALAHEWEQKTCR